MPTQDGSLLSYSVFLAGVIDDSDCRPRWPLLNTGERLDSPRLFDLLRHAVLHLRGVVLADIQASESLRDIELAIV
jgi:hypothetical protein